MIIPVLNALWKALMLIATAQSMHFVGSANCEYVFLKSSGPDANDSRNLQVIVAGALCGATAMVIFIGMFLIRRRDRDMQRRSKKVMLSCAMFCPGGRLLVTPGGVLPSREITDKFNHRTFDEDFDVSHPVFQWIFRVSRNWAGVMDLIPKMRSHLGAQRDGDDENDDSHIASSQSSAIYDAETYRDYEVIFRERFCVAAASIAASMHLPMNKLGVIYDRIIETGTLSSDEKTSKRGLLSRRNSIADVEAALRQSLFGKGQLMVLTRKLTNEEVRKLENVGYKFALVEQVGRNLAHAMQIPQRSLDAQFTRLRRYADDLELAEKSGTWLSLFAMIPKPNRKGFDVAVKKDCQDQLPDFPLLTGKPTSWQVAILEQFDGNRVSQIASLLNDPNGKYGVCLGDEARHFVNAFHQAMLGLMVNLPKEWTNEARFWSKQLAAHYSHSENEGSTKATTIYAFTVMGDMHAHVASESAICRIPRTFFETKHRCYPGSPDHALLTKEIHAMFSPIFARKIAKERPTGRLGKFSVVVGGSNPAMRNSNSAGKTSSNSRQSMMEHRTNEPLYELVSQSKGDTKRYENNNLGGILVDSKTMVKTDSKDATPHENADATKFLGSIVAVSIVKPERTFVDELVGITRARFLPGSTRSNSY